MGHKAGFIGAGSTKPDGWHGLPVVRTSGSRYSGNSEGKAGMAKRLTPATGYPPCRCLLLARAIPPKNSLLSESLCIWRVQRQNTSTPGKRPAKNAPR